jgi:hypothetical protein
MNIQAGDVVTITYEDGTRVTCQATERSGEPAILQPIQDDFRAPDSEIRSISRVIFSEPLTDEMGLLSTPAEPSPWDDLRLVCEIAFEWCSEYGFTQPDHARAVWHSAVRLCPEAEPAPK